jgi:hypothetical protein
MNEKKPKNYTCKSCRSFQVCSDKNKLPEKLKPCALYQLKGNRQKKNKTMTDILADIKTLGKNDIIDKCSDTDCRYYRSSGCTDNCARGAYGHPDCPNEFLTEDEKKSHPEHRSAADTFQLPKDPHYYCKTIPESISQGASPETDPSVVDVINAETFKEPVMSLSDLFKACKEYGFEIIIRPIQK